MPVKDGSSCPGCGLSNYEGLCPHCRGDQDEYERELVPPFPSSHPEEDFGKSIEELKNQVARALIVPLHLLRGVHWSKP